MIRLVWAASVHTRYFLRRYMPTNILLDVIRTRRGLKWGVPAMLLSIPYLLVAATCRNLIEDGGPGWLHLLVLLFIYNAMKFTIMGPVSLVLLARIRLSERAQRRPQQRGEISETTSVPWTARRWSTNPHRTLRRGRSPDHVLSGRRGVGGQ